MKPLNFIGTLFFSLVVSAILPQTGRAQIVGDKFRVSSPGYVRFLHAQLHRWFQKNIFDFETIQSDSEKEYVQKFIALNESFGSGDSTHFIRSFSYSIRIKDGKDSSARLSLLDFANKPELRTLAVKILKERGVDRAKFGLEDKQLGFSWGPKASDFSVIVFEPRIEDVTKAQLADEILKNKAGPGVLEYFFNGKKLDSVELLEVAVESKQICPPAISNVQIDRRSSRDGSYYVCRSRRFEGRAVGGAGEQLSEKIRLGMNLMPDSVAWRSLKDFELIYP